MNIDTSLGIAPSTPLQVNPKLEKHHMQRVSLRLIIGKGRKREVWGQKFIRNLKPKIGMDPYNK